jgi:hypothetical protein
MKMGRRFTGLALALAAVFALPNAGQAQDYPNRTV